MATTKTLCMVREKRVKVGVNNFVNSMPGMNFKKQISKLGIINSKDSKPDSRP